MESFIGSIVMFAGNFAPRAWAFCAGQLLSISENTALFSILGTTFGGDGQTTFALPDLRGRVPIHPGQSPGTSSYALGQSGGVENVTLTANQLPAHSHQFSVSISAANRISSSVPGNAVLAGGVTEPIYISAPDGRTTMNPEMASATVAPTGGSQPVSTIQPVACVNYIICVEGIFPSRN